MSFKKRLNIMQKNIIGLDDNDNDAEVISILFEYDYDLLQQPRLLNWRAEDENFNTLNIISEKDSDRIENYLNHYLNEDYNEYYSDYNDLLFDNYDY